MMKNRSLFVDFSDCVAKRHYGTDIKKKTQKTSLFSITDILVVLSF